MTKAEKLIAQWRKTKRADHLMTFSLLGMMHQADERTPDRESRT